jgi:hypothetical protein
MALPSSLAAYARRATPGSRENSLVDTLGSTSPPCEFVAYPALHAVDCELDPEAHDHADPVD